MRCMLVGLGIGMTLMASGLKAQERLAPGDSVLVSYTVGDSGLPLFTAGSLHGVSQDSILMAVRSHGDTLSIPFYSLERLEVYRPANRGYLFATLGCLGCWYARRRRGEQGSALWATLLVGLGRGSASSAWWWVGSSGEGPSGMESAST